MILGLLRTKEPLRQKRLILKNCPHYYPTEVRKYQKMAQKTATLGLIQMSMAAEVDKNLAHAVEMIEIAAKKGADLVCLPELFTTKYFAQNENPGGQRESKILDTIPGLVSKELSSCARKNGVVIIGGSIYEISSNNTYNTSTIFDQKGNMIGIYRKTHIPQDQYYYEQEYFAPGDTGFRVFETDFGKIGIMICYDQWFPEGARICALLGADMVFYPTAIGTVKGLRQSEGNWHRAWENVMRGHAIANGMIVAGVNRVGKEDLMDFWGGSFVIGAFGKTLKRAGKNEIVLICQVDLEHGRNVREGWRFLENRRPECYSRLVEKA